MPGCSNLRPYEQPTTTLVQATTRSANCAVIAYSRQRRPDSGVVERRLSLGPVGVRSPLVCWGTKGVPARARDGPWTLVSSAGREIAG
jgi:hypothetical protein